MKNTVNFTGYLLSQQAMNTLRDILLAELPFPRPEYVPPTRWQRIKRAPRRAKVAILSAIHDRFFRDYCDYDY